MGLQQNDLLDGINLLRYGEGSKECFNNFGLENCLLVV